MKTILWGIILSFCILQTAAYSKETAPEIKIKQDTYSDLAAKLGYCDMPRDPQQTIYYEWEIDENGQKRCVGKIKAPGE